jgi:hypothetical protein
VEHGPLLLLSQWVGVPTDGYAGLTGSARALAWLGAVLALAVIGLALAPLLRRDAVARFWCLGHVLALLPLAAAPLTARYTLFAGLGAMALLATFVGGRLEGAGGLPSARVPRLASAAVAGLLVVLHVSVSPAELATISARFSRGTAVVERSAHGLAPDAGSPDQRIVVVKAPRDVFVVLSLLIRAARNEPIGGHTIALAYTRAPVQVSRLDARTLVVVPKGAQEFLLAPRNLESGRTIGLTGLTVQVGAVSGDGLPLEARVAFDAPLEDPSLKWFRWSEDRAAYVPFTPPAIGETVVIR